MSRRDKYLAMGLLLTAAVAAVTALSPFSSEGNPDVTAQVVTTFRDPAIDESSGLVVRGDRIYTVNDSGDGPKVYAVDRRTGRTAGVITYDDQDPVDVESIAQGRGDTLWVGDTGDNRRERGSIRVFRFRGLRDGGTVRSVSLDLAYPDGPHDAETLLVQPRTQRLLVVTKRPIIGGVVYRAPKVVRPGEMAMLQPVAAVPGMVTDGTFLPDGRHVLLRTSGSAAVYTYPGFHQVTAFDLPTQDQGEGIAIGDDGRVYLSSEGEHSPVLAMDLPRSPEKRPPHRAAKPAKERAAGALTAETGSGDRGYVVAAVAGAGLLGLVVVRASRRRSRRTR